ncbi:disulfide bond formation protein B [Paraburkholderia hayleyella]|uniref:disulfide bond formation protein B n=1 Tax=Paraburkholderia hayleyella TaxID=2152889 RepID=UPI001292A98D|nr:disulfide bond formation protein B [Paraburkholderia hayleyella]
MNYPSATLRHERLMLVLLGLVCLGLVAGALYFQHVRHEDPCPLCILQRYFFLLIALFAFLGARFHSWTGVRVLEAMAALAAAGGIVTAARHMYVQANPGFSCGFDALQPIIDSLPPATWLPSVFKVGGLCETLYPPVLGISLPGWSLIAFVLAFIPLVLSLWRHRNRARQAARP